MKTITTATLSLLLCAAFALPSAAQAGKGGPKEDPNRDPSNKTCEFVAVAPRCLDKLQAAYSHIESLKSNQYVFTSRNGEQDASTLMCKISGADIKLAQEKDGEASYLLYKVMEKIWSLEGQGKFEDAGIKALVEAAKYCVDNP